MKKYFLALALLAFVYSNSQTVYTSLRKTVKPPVLEKDISSSPATDLKTDFVYKDGLLKTVSFTNTDGEVVATLKYYKDELPLFLKENLKSSYPTLKLFGVTELSTKEKTTYEIVMYNSKKWVRLTADSYGNFISVKRFKKA